MNTSCLKWGSMMHCDKLRMQISSWGITISWIISKVECNQKAHLLVLLADLHPFGWQQQSESTWAESACRVKCGTWWRFRRINAPWDSWRTRAKVPLNACRVSPGNLTWSIYDISWFLVIPKIKLVSSMHTRKPCRFTWFGTSPEWIHLVPANVFQTWAVAGLVLVANHLHAFGPFIQKLGSRFSGGPSCFSNCISSI